MDDQLRRNQSEEDEREGKGQRLRTANMDIFPHITFDPQYERSSDSEDTEGKESGLNTSAQTRCADMSTSDLDELEKSKTEVNTVRQTAWALNCFQTWLNLKNIQVNFQQVTKTELNTVLREFYGSIRTTKGELYSISSYLGLRAGLNRYVNEPPVSRLWNLMQDPEFIPANNVFKGVIKKIRRAGKDKTTHHPPISPEDQRILKHSAALSPENPKGLLNKVWYDIQLHFGRRGKEGNRHLKPDSFILKCDDKGAKYFTMTFNKETTNHKDPLERDGENMRGAMYEERGNALCPVTSLEKYLQKIPPDAKALYLQPRRDTAPGEGYWYTSVPLGVNQLSQMLPRMCREAGTQTSYTNHSLRATAVQKLSDAGLEAREIIAASGYRSESSLKSYWRPSMESRKRWSNVLSDRVNSSETPTMSPKHRVALQSSEVPSGPSVQQHQPQLDSTFMLLEENIIAFVKKELKKIQKVLSPDDPECSETPRDDDNGDDEEQRSSREALMKMILNFLRRMKQEDLAERLQNNVQHMLPVKMEAPEETSHGVVLQVPESSYIKEEVEEVWIGQEEKQLFVREESSTASFPVSTTSIKSEDDAETPLFSQLHEDLKEEDDCPTNRSNHQMTGIISDKDSGGAESTWNPNLNAGAEMYNSSETEDSEDDEEYRNMNHPNFEMKRLPESDMKDSEWESGASVAKRNNTSKSLIISDCGEQFNKHFLKRHKTQGCSSGLVSKKYLKVKKTVESQNTVQTKPTSFTCEDYGKTFHKQRNLNRHNKIHTGEKTFRCDLCGHSFSQKSTLVTHKKIHTGEKTFWCDICGQSCRDKAALVRHRRIHTGEKPFRCDLCGHSFMRKSHLDQHRSIHTGEKPFRCDLCGQSFSHKSTLFKHRKIHTGEKQFRCDLCGHKFSHRYTLVRHRRIHTGDKPFHCDLCGHSFSDKSTLNRHKRIHTGEKPFRCDLCGHRFTRKSYLDQHRKVHKGEKPFHFDL